MEALLRTGLLITSLGWMVAGRKHYLHRKKHYYYANNASNMFLDVSPCAHLSIFSFEVGEVNLLFLANSEIFVITAAVENERLIAQYAKRWHLKCVSPIVQTFSGAIMHCSRNGQHLMLKVFRESSSEAFDSEVLRAYDGIGTVKVLEVDGCAVLTERIFPGTHLAQLTLKRQDREATRQFAELLSRLQAVDACPTRIRQVRAFSEDFEWYLSQDDRQLERYFVHEAAKLFATLVRTTPHTMLLHGDLHHYNILQDEKRGWLMIDPKGLLGDPVYDVGAFLRNPIELGALVAEPRIIASRLEILHQSLKFDVVRMLEWAFVQSVLAQIWLVMSRQSPNRVWRKFTRATFEMLSTRDTAC